MLIKPFGPICKCLLNAYLLCFNMYILLSCMTRGYTPTLSHLKHMFDLHCVIRGMKHSPKCLYFSYVFVWAKNCQSKQNSCVHRPNALHPMSIVCLAVLALKCMTTPITLRNRFYFCSSRFGVNFPINPID